jgi:outer membrane protein assembly factor BamD (BamD/ComL family)
MKQNIVLTAIIAVSISACTYGGLLTRENDAATKAFRDADALFAAGSYDAAIGAYSEFTRHYPASSLADDAYLRIVDVMLYRPVRPTDSPWSALEAARDTLGVLLAKYPRTNRAVEVRNLLRVLDAALTARSERDAARDSIAMHMRDSGASANAFDQVQRERESLRQRVADLERIIVTLEAEKVAAADQTIRLEEELRRTREEAERMRRILMDLDRRATE